MHIRQPAMPLTPLYLWFQTLSHALGSCVGTTRLRSSSTCRPHCWVWACSSYSTPGFPPSPTTVCALPLPHRCTTSCWHRSCGWAWRLCTCTLRWSRSSTSTFPPTCSSSALWDGVRTLWTPHCSIQGPLALIGSLSSGMDKNRHQGFKRASFYFLDL